MNHEGAWLAGVNGAAFGLMMPGLPLIKARYYQEVAPRVAMDRAEVVSLTETMKTPAGEFMNCLKTDESTPLEPLVREAKHYARGIGLIQDGSLKLVKYGPAKQRPLFRCGSNECDILWISPFESRSAMP